MTTSGYVTSAAWALILFLYAAKAVILHHICQAALAGGIFVAVAALCVPVTWGLSPDWDNEFVLPAGNYFGSPIGTLTIPCGSFFIDLARRSAGCKDDWYWRVPLEILVGIPAWVYLWVYIQFLVLGWVWI